MIAYYVYGTLRFRQVLEKRLDGKVDLAQLKISYLSATLIGFQRLVASTYDGANAAFPVKGQKISGEKIETITSEAGTFKVPEGALLLIDGSALELVKVLPLVDRYEQSYVKIEVPVEDEKIKRAYLYACYPWRITPANLSQIKEKSAEKLLSNLTSYYNLSRMPTEEVQKFVREAYEKEIQKNKSTIIIHGREDKNKIES